MQETAGPTAQSYTIVLKDQVKKLESSSTEPVSHQDIDLCKFTGKEDGLTTIIEETDMQRGTMQPTVSAGYM